MTFGLALALALHQLATIVWIGGMFFAHMALRPAVNEAVKGPNRVVLMLGVFRRFFPWVWASIVLIWGSGSWYFLTALKGKAALHVHVMMGIALCMTLVFVYIYTVPYRKLQVAVSREDWNSASSKVAQIRRLILVNLLLGLITALAGSAGSLFLAGLAGSAIQAG
jgi:uncharacterized membrane protein